MVMPFREQSLSRQTINSNRPGFEEAYPALVPGRLFIQFNQYTMFVRFLPCLLFLFSTNSRLYAQKHDYFSVFGYGSPYYDHGQLIQVGGATIDFNASPAKVFVDQKKIDMSAYCGICSDSSGMLQFYTNGISIRNRTHETMENGNKINPGEIWDEWHTQYYPGAMGAMAIPAPGLPNNYYLFHLATYFDTVGPVSLPLAPTYYSLIDMNFNGGLGKVVSKNNILTSEHTIGIALVKHGNGRDWWFLTGVHNTNRHLLWLIDPTGIHGPFEQDLGPGFPTKEGMCNLTFSPDGSLFIRNDCRNGMRIYDFDRCSGLLSNLRIIPGPPDFRGLVTFSPSSRRLYVSSYDAIAAMDLQNTDPASTWDTLTYYDGYASPTLPYSTGFWFAQIEPDGQIWWGTTNSTVSMHVVHHPDLPGLAADIEQHGIELPRYNDGTVCRFPNYRLGALTGSPCDTLHMKGPRPPGFQDYPYTAREQDFEGYRILSPIPGKAGNTREYPDDFMQWSIKRDIEKATARIKGIEQKH